MKPGDSFVANGIDNPQLLLTSAFGILESAALPPEPVLAISDGDFLVAIVDNTSAFSGARSPSRDKKCQPTLT